MIPYLKLIYSSSVLLSQMEPNVKDSGESEILPNKLACHTFINVGKDSGIRRRMTYYHSNNSSWNINIFYATSLSPVPIMQYRESQLITTHTMGGSLDEPKYFIMVSRHTCPSPGGRLALFYKAVNKFPLCSRGQHCSCLSRHLLYKYP